MGAFGKIFLPDEQPKLACIQHNRNSFLSDKIKHDNSVRLENYVLHGGANLDLDTHKISCKKKSDFYSPSVPIEKRIHPDTGIFLYKKHVENAVLKMKSVTGAEGTSSVYDQIFYASKLTKLDSNALMALLFCENSGLQHDFSSANINSKLKDNCDRGLFQISDGTRLSMNEPTFINEFVQFMGRNDGTYSTLKEMVGYFGINPADYPDNYNLAKMLIQKITEYDPSKYNKQTKKNGVVSKNRVYGAKYNTFAAVIVLAVNLEKFDHNYQLAAFSYKRGRTTTNNYLEDASKYDMKRTKQIRMSREDEAADYSHKFWSYYSGFQAYHTEKTLYKEFKDEVASFYDQRRP